MGRPDPGLQPERTSLAWKRTLLGLVAVTALCARTMAPLHARVLVSVALYAAVAGFLAVRQSVRSRRVVSGTGSTSSSASVLDVVVLAATTVGVAVQVLWWVVTGR